MSSSEKSSLRSIDLYLEYFPNSKENEQKNEEEDLKVSLPTFVTICAIKMAKVIPTSDTIRSFIIFHCYIFFLDLIKNVKGFFICKSEECLVIGRLLKEGVKDK